MLFKSKIREKIKEEEIKNQEKAGKEWTEAYLPAAFDEAEELIGVARRRKEKKWAARKTQETAQ